MRQLLRILLPSLIFGAVGTVVLFRLLDPMDFGFVRPLELGRKTNYGIGFVFLWAIAAGSSALTFLLNSQR